jgi:SAM-dependent methyltransferase
VDIAPTPIDSSVFPPNLSLEIDDITLGLGHFAGQIDLVHMRCVSGGIRDIDKTLQELQQCLKPGGLLIVVDGDGRAVLSEDRKTIIPFMRLPGDGGPEVTGASERGSWLRRLLFGLWFKLLSVEVPETNAYLSDRGIRGM